MNKQQLANRIWESANKMRSKIEANEYKDYILGFLFYKYLSDKELKMLIDEGYEDYLEELTSKEGEPESEIYQSAREHCQNYLGYFIEYDALFSSWIAKGSAFQAGEVNRAIGAFNRSISANYKKLFEDVFRVLETNLSKLGESEGARTKAIRNLIELIDDVPTDDKQGYDVLGFVYEYLISNFAANAGKKAGEFYTPHEVSLLMSEIVADHLKGRDKIEIYDPTSGSGSLLINIGKCFAKRSGDKDSIKYYAQELKENTYNLTRMNLVMRGILPANIEARCGDTLADDWPFFDDNKAYEPLFVDAVVSNPPYSQHWVPENADTDARFSGYGVAPASKADFAFLLHDLYHVNDRGIMTIVLPHGVLFRGGSEGEIRRNLIENNQIDAIIGLPANIFFGTSIPTIIIVLKKNRPTTDVLIVDASKHFVKEGKNNKLSASDVKRIVDVVVERKSVPKFSRLVSKEEIRANEYNLNIPRYVDSSEPAESWDVYATMRGGLPNAELDALAEYWRAFPNLRAELFSCAGGPYSTLAVDDVRAAVLDSADVKRFQRDYADALGELPKYLKRELIENLEEVQTNGQEALLGVDLFKRLEHLTIVDRYAAYQILDDQWTAIATDLEILQTEGRDAARKCDPVMKIKKVKGVDTEVQDGWSGRVFPLELVQRATFSDKLAEIFDLKTKIEDAQARRAEIVESFTEEEKAEFQSDDEEEKDENAPITDKMLRDKEKEFKSLLKKGTKFDDDSFEKKVVDAVKLSDEEKALAKKVKTLETNLNNSAKDTIESLTDEQIDRLLADKWIAPYVDGLKRIPGEIVDALVDKVEKIAAKYRETFVDVEEQIESASKELAEMLGELTGNEFDMKGIDAFKALLQGGM